MIKKSIGLNTNLDMNKSWSAKKRNELRFLAPSKKCIRNIEKVTEIDFRNV